jgi:hypothetical protein
MQDARLQQADEAMCCAGWDGTSHTGEASAADLEVQMSSEKPKA